MCGIMALAGREPADLELAVQMCGNINHRGQEAVGMAATAGPRAGIAKPLIPFQHAGLVQRACNADRAAFRTFTKEVFGRKAKIFLGQTRYSTVERDDVARTQPLYVNHPRWGQYALDHNGQISLHDQLRKNCEKNGHTFRTYPVGDTEALAITIAQTRANSLMEAVVETIRTVVGTFSLLLMTNRQIIAARDRLGNKPLWRKVGKDYVAYSSEVAGLPQGEGVCSSVAAGSMEVLDLESLEISTFQAIEPRPAFCIFEDLYFSRPDQIHEGKIVGNIRRALGRQTARDCPIDVDMICYVPESGFDAGFGLAEESGIYFDPRALVRNFYNVSDRTFILPGQEQRLEKAEQKYFVSPSVVCGKRVGVGEDSLVRGNTLRVVNRMLYAAGAKEVHNIIASAPIRYPCFGGIDIPSQNSLMAAHLTEAQIAKRVGATSVHYLPLESMLEVANQTCSGHCAACFNSCYPYPLPD